jgi:hypothetical protein
MSCKQAAEAYKTKARDAPSRKRSSPLWRHSYSPCALLLCGELELVIKSGQLPNRLLELSGVHHSH